MDYIHSNGFSYTQEEIEQAAKKRNMSVQDYLDKTPELKPGKAQDSTVDPTMSQDDMGSQSAGGSLESQEELSDAEQFSNVFSNAVLGLQEAWESTKIAGAQFGSYLGVSDEKETDKYIVDQYKKLDEISAKMGDTGKGIVKGVKEGDFTDVGIGVVNALTSVITTVAPAMLTRGASLVPQIMAPMYTEYNSEKAKALYGDDEERAIEKLIKNKEDEVAIPMALGVASVALEKVGIKGISKYVLNNAKTQGAKRMADLVLTGNKEGLTEYFQGGLNVANKSFAQGDSTAVVSKKVFDHMGSEDALEEYVQGFVGGSGMSAAGSKINSAFRDKNDNKIVNDYVNAIGALNQQKVASKTEEAKGIVDKKIKEIEKNFKEFLISNQKKSEYLTEEQSTEAISILDAKKELSVKLQDINNKLKNGEINKSEHSLIVEDINNQFETNNKNLNNIKVEANKKLLHDDLRISGKAMSKIKGLSQKIYKTPEDFLKALNAKGKKQYTLEEIQGVDGLIVGKEVLINETVAAENNAVTVGSHELLHAIVKSSITGKTRKVKDVDGNTVETDLTEDGAVLIKDFLNELNSKENKIVQERIDNNYRYNRNAKGEIVSEKAFEQYAEEYLNAYADAAIKNELSDSVLEKLGKFLQKIFNNGDNGYQDLSFKTGKDVKTFLKSYVSDRKKGSFRQQFVDMAQEGVGQESTIVKKSVSTPLEAINNLIPKNIKTKKEFDAFVQDRRLFPPVFMATMDDGVISNYVKSKSIGDEYKGAIESVQNRITNFDPEATRADGSIVGPEGFGEFIFANTRFGKLDSKKALAIKAEKIKQEVRGDKVTETGKTVFEGLVSEEPSKKKKAEPKGQKRRVLKSLADVTLENKEIISTTARAEINALIEQNPKNLEEKLTNLIEKEITKAVKKQMGKISNAQGEVVVSDEYKAFIALNYENIVQGLDVSTIKNNYKTLFELTEIGKEDRRTLKSDKPSLKKDSNYRKSIFKIETNKAKFTKFFTEGGYTTLLARQKGLANQIAKGITEDVINNEIIENSKDLNAVTEAEFRNFAKSLNKQKAETVGNYADQIKFSKTALKDANFLRNEIKTQGVNKVFKDGKLLPKYNKLNKKAADFIYSLYKGGLIEDINDITYIQRAFKKLFKAGKRGEAYEYSIIDQAITLEKMLGKDVVNVILRKPTEVGGKPDAIIKIYDTVFNIEAKMTNAQYSSVTFAVDDNKFLIKKDYTFNDQILPLGKQVQKGIRAAKARLKKEGYDWNDISIMPTDLYNMLKSEPVTIDGVEYSSYINAMSAEMDIPLDVVSEIYNKKKGYPVNVIQLMGRGLFYMGGFNNVANILNLPLFKGNAKLTLRVGSNSQKRAAIQADVDSGMVESIYTDGTNTKKKGEKKSKRQVKTGNKSLSFRAIPTLSPDVLNSLKSDKSIGTMAGLKSIVDSKEGQALKMSKSSKNAQTLNNAVQFSRSANNPTKGITVLDFDDTLATSKSLVISTSPDGVVRKLTAEEFATEGADLLDQGWTHDFSEFSKVVDGKVASLFKKAMKLQGKFGPENMFVLTARPADSAPAIFEFLKANGLNIPLKNITGLANSTAESKALWIADKVGEGYNDFYFADDALQNVQAVDNMLEQFDVKRKVQQAKVKFSKSMNDQFNDILENVTGINSEKRFSAIKGRKRGESKGKFRVFIPPSHEDFVGLLYNFLGKGKEGNAHRDFFEQALIRPLNRANREFDTARQSVANDYKNLAKRFPKAAKALLKKTPDGDFTYQDAVRVYLWDKHGHTIPGLSPTDQTKLVELVNSMPGLKSYAENVNIISKQETYVNPTEGWNSGDIRMDLDDATGRIGRQQFFSEFIENADIIFSEENLNKIEAGYGKGVRESLEDMLYRIKTGRNRPSGQNAQVNKLMNYLNGSIGTVMFFNMRSALLQQMSIVNYINFADNNIFAAAKAFANQKQYWKDFAFIFNSDMLKQRRGGIQTDVNGAELAASLRNSKDITRKLISKLLELGFLPTQIGDNIAIATGGAAYYRNRINTYLKQGLSQKEAEARAFTDFQDITQSTQQSARPDMVSKQQASVIGKVILNFQNITSQMNRIGKKSFSDIYNRRITKPNTTQMQSDISNAARITYYFAIQNAIFYTLQTALFAMMFDDDEEDNNKLFLKKKERLINGSIDSVLRGTGLIGGVVATLKNVAIAFARQRDAKYNPDESAVLLEALNLSPVLGIKGRKITNAEKTLNYNKKVIDEMETFDIDNPQWSAATNYTEALTNIPLNRLYNKTQNVRQALNNDHSAWERSLMFLGWSQYNLDLENKKMEEIKEKTKSKKKKKKNTNSRDMKVIVR